MKRYSQANGWKTSDYSNLAAETAADRRTGQTGGGRSPEGQKQAIRDDRDGSKDTETTFYTNRFV